MVFKSYLSYSQIGLISWCTLPFSLKLIWAPLVERYYFKSFGKRKSWIVPMQLIASFILYWLSEHIQEFLEQSEARIIAASLMILFFFIATQDIAVDGWAAEILLPENSSYASSS